MTRSVSPEASTSYARHRPAPAYGQLPPWSIHQPVVAPARPAPGRSRAQPSQLEPPSPRDAYVGRPPSPDLHHRDENRALIAPIPRTPFHPTLPPANARASAVASSSTTVNGLPTRTHYHTSQDVRPSPTALSARSPSHPARYGYNHRALESPGLSSFPSPHHEAISPNIPRPRTSTPVFHNINDLAAHHGIPVSLPPLPRTTPRTQAALDFAHPAEPSTSSVPPASPDLNFSNLCSNYLTMLSQKNEPTAPAVAEDVFPASAVSNDDEAAVQALMDVIQATPEFTMAHDHAEYLTSPQFLTSPLESPWDDFLPTPAIGAELEFSPDILTSPAMDFDATDFGGMPLFDMPLFNDAAASAYKQPQQPAPKSTVAPEHLDNLFTLSPETPALDPASLQTSPALLDASSFAPPSVAAPQNPARRKAGPTGTRKNVTPSTLIPLDAPIQPRNYLTPSATSRKDVPATFARKRSRTAAGLDDEEPMPQVPLDATEEEAIKIKRLQNTLAARRSRKRKLEYQKQLEDELDGERAQKEGWRARARMLESLLVSHGIDAPPLDPELL